MSKDVNARSTYSVYVRFRTGQLPLRRGFATLAEARGFAESARRARFRGGADDVYVVCDRTRRRWSAESPPEGAPLPALEVDDRPREPRRLERIAADARRFKVAAEATLEVLSRHDATFVDASSFAGTDVHGSDLARVQARTRKLAQDALRVATTMMDTVETVRSLRPARGRRQRPG
jgi:hypothetical protein